MFYTPVARTLPGRLASKLARRLLPFGKQAKRHREYYLPQCLPCPAEAGVAPAGPEDQGHFFRCRCPRRRELLKKMLVAARKASENCDVPLQLANLLAKCMQAHWGGRAQGWRAKREYYGILVAQPRAGAEQAFLGRFSKLRSATHGKEAKATSVAKHRLNDGQAWVRRVCSAIWGHAHLMWLERNQGRHGREPKERAGRARQKSLQEVAARHS